MTDKEKPVIVDAPPYDYVKGFSDGRLYEKRQKEEPVSEDLEEAVIEECAKLLKGETVIIDGYEYVVLSDAEECFKAGANWQKKKEQQRLHSDENLQALSGRYAYEEWDEDLVEVARDSFIDGYNICKQQMSDEKYIGTIDVGGVTVDKAEFNKKVKELIHGKKPEHKEDTPK